MVVSSSKDLEVAGRGAGLVDHEEEVTRGALNPS
jgi:hypothetical protein